MPPASSLANVATENNMTKNVNTDMRQGDALSAIVFN
jgi:hypothetical protein